MTEPRASTPVDSLRARNRADIFREIVRAGRRQLAEHGAAALSLRAIARELGMASSALYRYVASRDELLTLLITDAYDSSADAASAAVEAVEPADLEARWRALCYAVREWAIDHPHEYALIYGSPVPGYRGTAETTAAAVRTPTLLSSILRDAAATRAVPVTDPEPPDRLRADLIALAAQPVFADQNGVAAGIPPALLMRGLMAWVQIFGLISFELFGQFNNTIENVDEMYRHAIELLANQIL